MKGLTESCTMMLIIMLFLASNTSFKIFAVPNKYVFCVFLCMFYSHSVPIAAIYFSKSVDIAPNAPTKKRDYNHLFHAPHSCSPIFKHFIFRNLSFFPFIHPFISRYGNIYNLNFYLGFINNNNIWSSSLNLCIALNCKIPQNLVLFVLKNSIWIMLVPLLCSLKTIFFT